MKIFITGATGYVGCELAHTLADNGHDVHALVRTGSSTCLLVHQNIKIFMGDILDPRTVAAAMAGCEQVYHIAAFVKICARDRRKFYDQNVTGTENVLRLALEQQVQRVVFTSTCGVWGITDEAVFAEGHPRIAALDNDYEVSKIMAEKVVAEYCSLGLDCVIVNPSKVFGVGTYRHPGKMNYNTFVSGWFRKRFVFLPWQLKVTSNLVFLHDLVQGHILAMNSGRSGERYILGGDNVSVEGIVDTIREIVPGKKWFIRVPTCFVYLWSFFELLAAAWQRRDPVIVPALVGRLGRHTRYSSARAINQLGYRITPFREALLQTMKALNKPIV